MLQKGKTSSFKIGRLLAVFGMLLILTGISINSFSLSFMWGPKIVESQISKIIVLIFQLLCIIGGYFSILFRKNNLTAKIYLMLFGFFLTIPIIEVYFRFFSPQFQTDQHDNLFAYDVHLGWKFIPNQKSITTSPHEFTTEVIINSNGFRGKEYHLEKKEGLYRIAILGDSFTSAIEVPLEFTFSHLVEEKDSRLDILNFGVNGYGPVQEYLLLKNTVLNFKPDEVALFFYIGNDFFDTAEGLQWIQQYERPYAKIDKRNNLIITNIPVPSPIAKKISQYPPFPRTHIQEAIQSLFFDKYRLNKIPPEISLFDIYPDKEMQDAYSITLQMLREIAVLCKENNILFTLYVVPTIVQTYEEEYWPQIEKKYGISNKKFDTFFPNRKLAHLQNIGIKIIDLTRSFKEQAKTGDLFFYKNRHLNKQGHNLVAEIMYESIAQNENLMQKNGL